MKLTNFRLEFTRANGARVVVETHEGKVYCAAEEGDGEEYKAREATVLEQAFLTLAAESMVDGIDAWLTSQTEAALTTAGVNPANPPLEPPLQAGPNGPGATGGE